MQKVVRIASVEDHDRHRREDVRRMTPNQRVALLLAMQRRQWPGWGDQIAPVVAIRRLGEAVDG